MNKYFLNLLSLFFAIITISALHAQSSHLSQYIAMSEVVIEGDKEEGKSDEVINSAPIDSIKTKIVSSDTSTVVDAFEEDLIPIHHYDILHDECKISSDMFTYTDAACDENPYIETMIADSLFWMGISPYYNCFDTKSVNPYITNDTRTKYLSDTVNLVLYDINSDEKQWSMPLKISNLVTSTFMFRRYRWHKGTDLNLETGDTVYSVFDGVVRISGYNPGGYGHYVLVRHFNGLETVYGHLSVRHVCPGQPVKAGEMIGLGGNTGRSTGSHLHFETRFRGVPLDSEFIYDYKNQKIKSHEVTILPKYFSYVNGVANYSPNGKMYHRIRSGDTLGAIARRYRTYVSTLCKLNGIRSTTILRIGRNLRVR